MNPRARLFFTEDFDQAAPKPAEPAAPPPELFTAEHMAACRAAAWREGHAAGLAARADDEIGTIRSHLAAIDVAIRAARADLAAQADATAQELAQLLLALFAVALPELCARHAMTEIRAVATAILPALIGEPAVRLQTRPAHFPALQKYISELDPDLVNNVTFQADDTMGPSDIVIRWDHGDATRSAAQIWQTILSILDPLGFHPAEPATLNHAREPAHVE